MPFSKNPAFNLKAVLQETGIAADTLRAWERRYSLPMPQRTAGGHRLYSQHDIETIKWLMVRQAEGLSISRAVDLWNEQTASGADPLAVLPQRTIASLSPAAIHLRPKTSLESLRAHWLTACLNFNEADAEYVLNQAFAMHPVETVCTEVLQLGLAELGTQWYENRASVQQEHFASSHAMRRLDILLSASPAPIRKETILVGCPANEWHAFTPLLISLFLRRRGMNVIYLGANVPGDRFEETLSSVRTDMVLLVAQQLRTAASLMEFAKMPAIRNTSIAFGGRIFILHPGLHHRIAGYFLGDSIEGTVMKIESFFDKRVKYKDPEAITQEYVTAITAFQSHRPQIEATLNQSIGKLGFAIEVMRTATEFMCDNIIAALQLGQISCMNAEIDWVRGLLKTHQIPESALDEYLRLFSEAVNLNLKGSGNIIHKWLAEKVTSRRS